MRRTLITVGAMVGACAAIVGALTLAAVSAVSHTLSAAESDSGEVAASSNAPKTPRGPRPGGKPILPGFPARMNDARQGHK